MHFGCTVVMLCYTRTINIIVLGSLYDLWCMLSTINIILGSLCDLWYGIRYFIRGYSGMDVSMSQVGQENRLAWKEQIVSTRNANSYWSQISVQECSAYQPIG